MESKEEIVLSNKLGYMEYKSQFYGLIKKFKNERNNGFIFIQIFKLTIKIYSSLSKINIGYHLYFRILIMPKQYFKILSKKSILCENLL